VALYAKQECNGNWSQAVSTILRRYEATIREELEATQKAREWVIKKAETAGPMSGLGNPPEADRKEVKS